MADITIEQAIYAGPNASSCRLLARSPGFHDEWLAEAERLCVGFGQRPTGIACPECVFAQPLGNRHVAVVQVADQGTGEAWMTFRFLMMARPAYLHLLGDPFAIADRFPPPWGVRGELPTLVWPAEPLPPRTVRDVQHVLKNFDSPTLLGSVQTLVDGGRVVFQRGAPDSELLRNLWKLLPTSTRCEIWPASFAFGNDLGFHVLVVPEINEESYARYLKEEEAGDYPEGRYELGLQIAAEAGDQRELDALFARRSSTQMFRLLILLIVLIALIALVMRLLMKPPPARQAEGLRDAGCRVAQVEPPRGEGHG